MPVYHATDKPLVIGAKGLAGIEQAMATIISTTAYSVPLDCNFAHAGRFIDAPAPHVAARHIAALTAAIEAYEPRVQVQSITLKPAPDGLMQGKLYPCITYTLKEGVEV